MKTLSTTTLLIALGAVAASAQSPAATETATIAGKTITIKYSAPKVNGRAGKIFAKGGLISNDRTYPAWRAGANSATAFHTDANLDIAGLAVPAGDYTLFIDIGDENNWQLIINKQTGQWGLRYDKAQDFGRVKMAMAKPAGLVEDLRYTISSTGGNKGKLQIEWENKSASVAFTVK